MHIVKIACLFIAGVISCTIANAQKLKENSGSVPAIHGVVSNGWWNAKPIGVYSVTSQLL